MAVFFWSHAPRSRPPAPAVDLTPAYFVLCLLSASTANARSTFYAGLVAASRRGRCGRARGATGIARWVGAVALAAALGWAGHVAVAEASVRSSAARSVWILSWVRRDADPFRNTTALGRPRRDQALRPRGARARAAPARDDARCSCARRATTSITRRRGSRRRRLRARAARGRRRHLAARPGGPSRRPDHRLGLSDARARRARAARRRLPARRPHGRRPRA